MIVLWRSLARGQVHFCHLSPPLGPLFSQQSRTNRFVRITVISQHGGGRQSRAIKHWGYWKHTRENTITPIAAQCNGKCEWTLEGTDPSSKTCPIAAFIGTVPIPFIFLSVSSSSCGAGLPTEPSGCGGIGWVSLPLPSIKQSVRKLDSQLWKFSKEEKYDSNPLFASRFYHLLIVIDCMWFSYIVPPITFQKKGTVVELCGPKWWGECCGRLRFRPSPWRVGGSLQGREGTGQGCGRVSWETLGEGAVRVWGGHRQFSHRRAFALAVPAPGTFSPAPHPPNLLCSSFRSQPSLLSGSFLWLPDQVKSLLNISFVSSSRLYFYIYLWDYLIGISPTG